MTVQRYDVVSAAEPDRFVPRVWAPVNFRGLADEVLNLRRALSSRATIDQAKGIVMSERRCSADDAYRLLVQMSNDTNVRLADVAAALVYQAQGPACRSVDSDARESSIGAAEESGQQAS